MNMRPVLSMAMVMCEASVNSLYPLLTLRPTYTMRSAKTTATRYPASYLSHDCTHPDTGSRLVELLQRHVTMCHKASDSYGTEPISLRLQASYCII